MNKKILKKRVQKLDIDPYLKSEEYRKAVELPIIGENDEMVIFQNGFISNKQVVGFSLENDEEHCTSYLMDDYDIYSEILRKSYKNGNFDIGNIFNSICEYFELNPKAQYKLLLNELKGQIKLYGKMDKERLRDTIRDNLGRAINTHLYTKIRGYKSRTVILPDDVIAAPINIKEIKGLGVGKCLEYAILTQNIFSFLGFNMYMVTGQLSINDDDFDWHSWNVLEQNGTYLMIDVINGLVDGQLSNIKNKYDLLKFGERTYKNPMGVKLKYKSYMERERTLEDLAAKGKIFRAQASNYLNGRLAMYEYLRQKK